jgi:Flp pilus assembly protein TadD
VLHKATAQFKKGRYQKTLDLLGRLSRKRRADPEVRFLRGYALLRLKKLEQASQVIRAACQSSEDTDVRACCAPLRPKDRLLLAMIEAQQDRWSSAKHCLQPVVAAKRDSPWKRAAVELLERVEKELAEQEKTRALRVRAARLEALDRALAKKDLAQAKLLLKQLAPERAAYESRYLYYAGLIAFHEQRYVTAVKALGRAMQLAPKDRWTRYSLALAYAKQGNVEGAKGLLSGLATTQGAGQKDAQAALARLQPTAVAASKRTSRATTKGSVHRFTVRAATGAGVDNNPGFIDEVGGSWSRVAPSLYALAAGRYRLTLPAQLALHSSLQLDHRNYFEAEYNDAAHQTLDAALSLSKRWSSVNWTSGYGFQLYLLGFQALYAEHRGFGELELSLSKWLDLQLGARLAWRPIYQEQYAYLQQTDVGGAATLVAYGRKWRVSLGYGVTRSFALRLLASYSVDRESGSRQRQRGKNQPGPGGPPGTTTSTVYDIDIDYTRWSHGVLLSSVLTLPWRLTVELEASVLFSHFDRGDRLTEQASGQLTSADSRDDTRFYLAASVSRALGYGLSVALAVTIVENISSLNLDALGWNRSFSRHVMDVLLRYVWQ